MSEGPATEVVSHNGPRWWRSLEDQADDGRAPEGAGLDSPAMPSGPEGLGRRDFITLLGAMIAATGITGCGKPPAEPILPYARQPEGLVPGKPRYYATAMPSPDGALGLLVRTDLGRPTKIEGNPKHPASLGATDAFAQAELFTFWDPDRSQTILKDGVPGTWSDFQSALRKALLSPKQKGGEGFRILTGGVLSPTLAAQLARIQKEWPRSRWHAYDPLGRDQVRAGSRLAFGADLEPIPRLGQADVVVSFDSDFLVERPRAAREFAERRRFDASGRAQNRLYVLEPMPTVTGSAADHRWPLRASEIGVAVRELARGLGLPVGSDLPASGFPWMAGLVRDLRAHEKNSLVLAGPAQPPSVHTLVALINQALGNIGRSVVYAESPFYDPGQGLESISRLTGDLRAGNVEALLILGSNPVYSAPVDLDFKEALSHAPFSAALGLYADETAAACRWHLPEQHFLESWSDARAFDGTISLIQPLLAPLYGGKSAHELLAEVAGELGKSAYAILREHWKGGQDDRAFEKFWRTTLYEGIAPGGAFALHDTLPKTTVLAGIPSLTPAFRALEIVFRPDPCIADGRYSNNPWLQELPKPLSKLTWQNAAMMSPADAERQRFRSGDEVEIAVGGRSVRAPVFILPGHAQGSVTLHLGYGRSRAGRVGTGLGIHAGRLRTTGEFYWGFPASLKGTGQKHLLATTQRHHSMEGRAPVRVATAQALAKNPELIRSPQGAHSKDSLYPPAAPTGPAWGMVIDLGTCTGCNACITACQAENNIPVVGKEEVLRGREMHWIRLDTYFEGSPDQPLQVQQPVPCMHCENAPCEVVCPTAATAHSSEGLNQMVYNRCVGTRYCQNNCPYKVRRFNFYKYSDPQTPSLEQLYNPDVSVRERGVMEKCTYCVQRIVRTRIDAEKGLRPLGDLEVKTACQQVCPSGAIVFGDLSLRDSAVAKLRRSPLHYELLGELGTRPRTTYLGRVRNPNPELEGG